MTHRFRPMSSFIACSASCSEDVSLELGFAALLQLRRFSLSMSASTAPRISVFDLTRDRPCLRLSRDLIKPLPADSRVIALTAGGMPSTLGVPVAA